MFGIFGKKNKYTSEQAREFGEKVGADWKKFDVEEFRLGMIREKENLSTDDPMEIAKAVLEHLDNIPDYYTQLRKMDYMA